MFTLSTEISRSTFVILVDESILSRLINLIATYSCNNSHRVCVSNVDN